MTSTDELADLVVQAGVADLAGTAWACVALVTDDDALVLHWSLATRDERDAFTEPYEPFSPSEWTEVGSDALEPAMAWLRRHHARAPDAAAHVAGVLPAFTEAMVRLRAALALPDDTFVSFIGSDPDAAFDAAEERTVATANPRALVDAYDAWSATL